METNTETEIGVDKFLEIGCSSLPGPRIIRDKSESYRSQSSSDLTVASLSSQVKTLPGSCDHIASLKSDTLLENYKLLYSFYVACVGENANKRKAKDCKCCVESCETNRIRVHACLCCTYFGCFEIQERESSHIYRHAHENSHVLAMDTDSGHIFCFECNDYKYDHDLEEIAHELNLMACHRRTIDTDSGRVFCFECNDYKYDPCLGETAQELYLMASRRRKIRGFINIQHRCCSLIVIIQTLIHAPVFRDYLLSTKHRCKQRKKGRCEQRKKYHPWCSICEMIKLITEYFSGESQPLVIVDFLDLLSVRAKEYATNDWHDAAEFCLTLITLLCADCEGASSTGPCNCLINSMFFLTYCTEFTCNKCQKVTVSAEQTVSTLCMLSGGGQISLTDCLKKNLRESWSSSCPDCSQTGGKFRIVPKKLPYILSFSIEQQGQIISRREAFEQKKRGIKEDFVEYKEFLNLSPDHLTNVVNSRDGLKYPEYQYYLFSVIQFKHNHHTVYIRKAKNNWFRCNDTHMEPQTLEQVLAVNARMLFYHKQFI